MKYHDMIIENISVCEFLLSCESKIFCLENFYALLNNIIEKEYISKRGLFTPKCRSPPFLLSLTEKERMGVV